MKVGRNLVEVKQQKVVCLLSFLMKCTEQFIQQHRHRPIRGKQGTIW